jgi:hypothetical protein
MWVQGLLVVRIFTPPVSSAFLEHYIGEMGVSRPTLCGDSEWRKNSGFGRRGRYY